MTNEELQAAIGGPTKVPHQPEGGSDVQPLTGHHLARTDPEASPADVTAQQGAGGPYLAPGAQGVASDGNPVVGWKGDNYAAQGGPEQRPVLSDVVGRLTAGQTNRPEGGAAPAEAPVGRADTALGRDQSQGQVINPALKAALSPRLDGPFGKPS